MNFKVSTANRAVRVFILIAFLVTINFSGQTVTAQSSQPQWARQDVLDRLGIQRPAAANLTELSQQVAREIEANGLPSGAIQPQSPTIGGLQNSLNGKSAMSAAVMTTLNGSSTTNFRDVMLMADADGREDLAADHAAKLSDQSSSLFPAGWILTRTAVSEHTFANGFNSSVYYYGDSLGNVTVGVDDVGDGLIHNSLVINLPTVLNAFGNLSSDNQIVITGLAVNPVADLSSFRKRQWRICAIQREDR